MSSHLYTFRSLCLFFFLARVHRLMQLEYPERNLQLFGKIVVNAIKQVLKSNMCQYELWLVMAMKDVKIM